MNQTALSEQELLDRIRTAWAETLDIEVQAVPQDKSFFDAGGSSLLLLLLWELLNELTDADLTAADLFEHPTVTAQLALLAAPGAQTRVDLARAGSTQSGPAPTLDRRALLGRARPAPAPVGEGSR